MDWNSDHAYCTLAVLALSRRSRTELVGQSGTPHGPRTNQEWYLPIDPTSDVPLNLVMGDCAGTPFAELACRMVRSRDIRPDVFSPYSARRTNDVRVLWATVPRLYGADRQALSTGQRKKISWRRLSLVLHAPAMLQRFVNYQQSTDSERTGMSGIRSARQRRLPCPLNLFVTSVLSHQVIPFPTCLGNRPFLGHPLRAILAPAHLLRSSQTSGSDTSPGRTDLSHNRWF